MKLSLWMKVGLRDWHNYVPLVPTLTNYQREDLGHDITAGLVVGMVTIPQAVAYAFLAGVPPEAGLYACLVPMLLYALFGSSKELVVGPVAVAALMVAATVSEYAPRYSVTYMEITSIVCLQAGLILLLLRLSRMGGLVNLLSHPVITGFVNAAAILIIVSQLPAFTGIDVERTSQPFETLTKVLTHLHESQLMVFAFAAISLAILLLYPRITMLAARLVGLNITNQHPLTRIGPMVVAILGGLLAWIFGLHTQLPVVGSIPTGLPEFTIPQLNQAYNLQLWMDLTPAAFIIAVVSYIESYSIGATLAARKQSRVNSHQELIALGAANVGAAFTGAYPVAGSFSRSSVNFYAGGRTQVSSLVCAVVVVFALLFLTDLFRYLPHAILSAIVMVSVLGLMDLKNGREHWALHRDDVLTEYATLILVLFMGVEIGIIAGVLLSIAFFIRTSSRPNITQVGRLGNTEHFRSIKRFDVETVTNVLALRVDENIYFGNAAQIEDKFLKRAQRRKGTRHLLMVCSSVNMIDATGLQMLHRLNANLAQTGVQFHMSDIKGTLTPIIEGAALEDALSGKIFFTADRAMKHFVAELEQQQA